MNRYDFGADIQAGYDLYPITGYCVPGYSRFARYCLPGKIPPNANGVTSSSGFPQMESRPTGYIPSLILKSLGDHKAYADYLERKDHIFKDFSKMMLAIYMGSEEAAEKSLSSGIPVAVKTILPKTLYIDRKGNYGWHCYTERDRSYIDVLLSEDRPYIMESGSLKVFAEKNPVVDKEMGVFFDSYIGLSSTIIVRIGDQIHTLPFDIRIDDDEKVIAESMKKSFKNYATFSKNFWSNIPRWLLQYYRDTYDELDSMYDLYEDLQKENINEESVMTLLDIRKLYMKNNGRIAWLAEYPTAHDGLAFEFTDGFVDMILQCEII